MASKSRIAASLLARVLRTSASQTRTSAVSSQPLLFRRYGAAALAAEELEYPTKAPVEAEYTKLLINGEFVDAASGKTFPTIDPRTEQVIAHIAEGDEEDVNRAVKAARKAFDHGPWPRMPAYQRGQILLKYAPYNCCCAFIYNQL